MSRTLKNIRARLVTILTGDSTFTGYLSAGTLGLMHLYPGEHQGAHFAVYSIRHQTDRSLQPKAKKILTFQLKAVGTDISKLDDIIGRAEEVLQNISLTTTEWCNQYHCYPVGETVTNYEGQVDQSLPILSETAEWEIHLYEK